MKTYTKKIGADRAIASILAANAEQFEAQGVTLEAIKNDAGAWFIRCTGMSLAASIEPRIGEYVPAPKADDDDIEIDPALIAGGKFSDTMKPAEQAIPAQRRGKAKATPLADAITPSPELIAKIDADMRSVAAELDQLEDALTKQIEADRNEALDALEAVTPQQKPSLLDMATAVVSMANIREVCPKRTREEAATVNGPALYGPDAKEGVDFVVVKTGSGLFQALRPDVAATMQTTTRMVLTAEEAAAKKNRARVEQADRPKRTRGDGSKPVGMQAIVAELCFRPQGATPAELKAATKWQGTPWKWFLGNNPKKTGMADRFGYIFEARKGAGKEVTYFFRQPEAVDATASQVVNEQQVAVA